MKVFSTQISLIITSVMYYEQTLFALKGFCALNIPFVKTYTSWGQNINNVK